MALYLNSITRPNPEFILHYVEQIIQLGRSEICDAKKLPSSDAVRKFQIILDQLDNEQKALLTTISSDVTLKAKVLLELFEAKCMLQIIEYDETRWKAISFVVIATIEEAYENIKKIVDISLRLELLLHISRARLESFQFIHKQGMQKNSLLERAWQGTFKIQQSNWEKHLNLEITKYRKKVLNEQNGLRALSPLNFYIV